MEAFKFNSDLPTAFTKAFNAIPKLRSRYVPVSVSKSKIPFTILYEKSKDEQKTSDRNNANLSFYPTTSTGMCECGAEWGHMEICQEMPLVKYHETVMAKGMNS